MVNHGDGPAIGEQLSQVAMNHRLQIYSVPGQHLTWGIAASAVDGLWEALWESGRIRAATMDIYDGRWGKVAVGWLGPGFGDNTEE